MTENCIGRKAGRTTERGAALVEFAVVLPLLLIVLFGIIEFGLAINKAHDVRAAAYQASRVASLSSSSQADITARAEMVLGAPLATEPLVTPATCSGTLTNTNDLITVRVEVPHTISVPLVNVWNITLASEAVVQCQS